MEEDDILSNFHKQNLLRVTDVQTDDVDLLVIRMELNAALRARIRWLFFSTQLVIMKEFYLFPSSFL